MDALYKSEESRHVSTVMPHSLYGPNLRESPCVHAANREAAPGHGESLLLSQDEERHGMGTLPFTTDCGSYSVGFPKDNSLRFATTLFNVC